jgi:hypothetical protein
MILSRFSRQACGTVLAPIALVSAVVLFTFGPLANSVRLAGYEHSAMASFTSRVFASGAGITVTTPKGPEPISNPDDITFYGGHVFVGFQNGVGPQGQAAPDGATESTIVEYNMAGRPVGHWAVTGKCDGVTANPVTGELVATVNEDAHSSLYVIDPGNGAVSHYNYNEALPSAGGTDAITFYNRVMLISASAPGTTGKAAPQASYPAVYRTVLDPSGHIATVYPLFGDEATAIVANTGADSGHGVRLALTDPDSNEAVPSFAPRFGGAFMLTSQGDEEQIFVRGAGTRAQSLEVLHLSVSVDDTAWASGPSGALYTTDNGSGDIYKVTGPFTRGEVLVAATPCDQNNAPSTCPGPGFPANYLGQLDPETGQVSRVLLSGPSPAAQGMLFLG